MTLVTDAFEALAKMERQAFGAPDHPIALIEHPIGTVKQEEIHRRTDAAFAKLLESIVAPRPSPRGKELGAQRVEQGA